MKKLVLFIMMIFFSGFVQASSTPSVILTSPDNQGAFTAGSNITITAKASEEDGDIALVTFYKGITLLGQSIKSPYSFTWNEVPAGTYALTAVATDTDKVSTTSSAITITVTPAPPAVAITSPVNDTTFTVGSKIDLSAAASEFNGVVSNVGLYNGTILLKTCATTSSPCNYTWDNAASGAYTLTAVATDTNNISTISTPVSVTVTPASAPAISITSPAKNNIYTAGSNITITVSISESNATIREVFFYDNTNYLGSITDPQNKYTWSNVRAGVYSLTVEATDSSGGTLISAPVNITVNPAPHLVTVSQNNVHP